MSEPRESEVIHALKNHLGVITVMSELLIDNTPEGETRSDLLAIQQAGIAALALVPMLREGGA